MSLDAVLKIGNQVGWNALKGTGFLAGGFIVTAAVDKIAHSILKPTYASFASQVISFAAFSIGLSCTAYYAPQVALIRFTADQALKLLAADLFLTAGIYLATEKFIPILSIGTLTGAFGTHALAAFGGIGSMWGFLMEAKLRKSREPYEPI